MKVESAKIVIAERIIELRKEYEKTQSDKERNRIKEMEVFNVGLYKKVTGLDFDQVSNTTN